jgi:hypothetical protein
MSLELHVRPQEGLLTKAHSMEHSHRGLVPWIDQCFQAINGGQAQGPPAEQDKARQSQSFSSTTCDNPVAHANNAWLLAMKQAKEARCGAGSCFNHRKTQAFACN